MLLAARWPITPSRAGRLCSGAALEVDYARIEKEVANAELEVGAARWRTGGCCARDAAVVLVQKWSETTRVLGTAGARMALNRGTRVQERAHAAWRKV